MIFLSEIKMKDHRIIGVRRRMGYANGFNVALIGRAGGLSLWWDDSITVDVIEFSKHLIDARCCIVESDVVFQFTGIYGTSYRAEKEVFWRGMIQKFNPDCIPWICGGDFNEFLWDHEKVGGAEVRYNRPRYLEEFMNKGEIMDLGFNGQKFTWRGTRNGQLVEARLDRVLVNDCWLSTWPNSFVTNAMTIGSDHCPVVLLCEQKDVRQKKLFRFEAFWAKDAECKEIVREAWEINSDGSRVIKWNKKLLNCRTTLTSWSEMNESLLAEVSSDEVKVAAMPMGSLKASGPDGFPGIFYQSNWDTVATEVNALIGDLMNGSDIPGGLNASHLVLIPKVQKSESVEQFRPISLCNYSYKMLSKVLANRLKMVIPDLISPSQNAFVAERQIQDNIGIAHELFHFLKTRKARSQFELGIKLDMQKAYDRACDRKWIKGVQMNPLGPSISHILFADDTLIFIKAEEVNCRNLIHLIDEFCAASGQHVNKAKSSVCFGSNVPEEVSRHLSNILGFEMVGDPGMYLGVPAIWGRSKKAGLAYVKGQLLDKLQGWKKSTLTQAGREILIKAKGGRASWVWASLLAGREILREGAHWQIIDGNDTRVWVGRWLPPIPLGRPSPLGSVQVSKNLKVKSLICPESGDWDLDFLKPFLADSEVEAILDLHIGDPTLKDILVWPYEKRGSYSVKSGYYWCINRTIDRSLQSIRAVSIPSTLWKTVWKLKVPPKIRTFMWKTLHEALATMKNLYIRRSFPSPICPLCNSQDESIEHLFLFCPWVEVVWFGGMLNLRPIRQHVSSWASWLVQMGAAENGSAEVRINRISYIAFTCWHIWKSRCEFQFNNQAIYPSRVVAAVSRSVTAYQESTFRQSSPSLLIQSSLGDGVQWSPPNQGVIKINVDASWEARTGEGFTGVVARDEHGRFVAASRHKIKATGATMAEALAIMHGCILGVSNGWNSICIESDSFDAISCLRDPAKKGNWEAFPILRKCFRMGTAFQACRWSWVPRLANLVADCLASRNCKEVCDLIWVNRPPSSLVHVLCNDGLPCPP
ncbi:unnamed protein product [Malus baccata var. baccata]